MAESCGGPPACGVFLGHVYLDSASLRLNKVSLSPPSNPRCITGVLHSDASHKDELAG